MKTTVPLLLLFLLVSTHTWGQAKLRKLAANINHPAINNYAPFVSFDGNSMVYIADVAEDNALTMNFTVKDGVNWRDPVILPRSINTRLNFMKGFALSTDGKTLYITNARNNGLGGFDIYSSQLTGTQWSEPVNLGLPINSKGQEGCPSLSMDGNTMYFMRCEKMDFTKADNCKLMMATRRNTGVWNEPIELPAFINTGNSQTPRILGDGETLIFSSNKLQPNKGGMDLYFTKFSNGQWTPPQPLAFANTAADDQFVSASSLGRYLMRDSPSQRSNELVELLFPVEVRPKGIMKIEGLVSGVPDATTCQVALVNLNDLARKISIKPDKTGAFVAYAKEGARYDLSVEPGKANYTFFSKTFDVNGEKFGALEKVNAALKPVAAGDELTLDNITFEPLSDELVSTSVLELRRLTRLIKGNPDRFFSIQVTMMGYEEDSLRSGPELTEIRRDTMKIPVTYKVDSVTTAVRDSLVIKSTYHNDRTLLQAKAIGDFLTQQGIPPSKISCSGKAIAEEIPENRKTRVSVVIH